ncbi:hypothetical protein [Geosporobacter ferrireducens]|uniref:Alpha/beta hydrolase n=1 Tax=Geosporobacter ferrireducens TaxID=1424294 RepID=A0A1D8GQD5_9FIRM|nr:hypothetical protein [Geosporobacter ferrireducens]AOT73004.1 hypothetical protein Gferi_05380 [Geosporobacter ferrireducens]MTI56707.1 alpha/beta hydrolase [Geosporobacter ferrireducens]
MSGNSFVVVKVQKVGSNYSKLYYHQDKENALVVIFPGEDYSCDKPLLYYARKAAVREEKDVLCLSYKRKLTWRDTGQYPIALEADASLDVINKCMSKSYKNIYFVSKGIGTEVAGNISERLGYEKITNIFLAPTKEGIKHIVNSKSMVIVGTRDEIFTQEQIDQLKQHSNVQLVLIDEANHYLESTGSLDESIKMLNQIANLYVNTFKA